MKPLFAKQMKCAVVSAFVLLTFVSQTSAVLRPLFPIRPAAPSNGELIVIEDELALRSAKKYVLHRRGNAQERSGLGAFPQR